MSQSASSGALSFSAQQRERCAHLFQAFHDHPFLRGLADGSASRESVLHYVSQDHHYLTAFMRCYGLGIATSPDRDWLEWFTESIRFMLHDEGDAHLALVRAFDVDYEDVQVAEMTPTAQGYINHLIASGHDSLGVLMAALMPCPETYWWAADRQQREDPVAKDNPFRPWWEFYAGEESRQLVEDFGVRLDALAEQAGPAEVARMAQAYEDSVHHEIRFWQMAWTQERWDDSLTLGREPVTAGA
ncbi:thiaminase II [Ornithinimicrobium sp. Y1694]|uniref:thiaminase II n=1 Tax=Ornithinimicrobium sp. Y1694 TaxID=3418590 RepID=UPI003CF67641